MQKCWVTKDTVFTIEFQDSKDAKVFFNRAYDPFNFIGSLDMEDRHTITALFEKPEAMEKFENFLKDNLDVVYEVNGRKVYQLYRPAIPETVRIGG